MTWCGSQTEMVPSYWVATCKCHPPQVWSVEFCEVFRFLSPPSGLSNFRIDLFQHLHVNRCGIGISFHLGQMHRHMGSLWNVQHV